MAIHKGYSDIRKMKVATKVSLKMIQQIEEWSRKDFQLLPNYQLKETPKKEENNSTTLQKDNQQLREENSHLRAKVADLDQLVKQLKASLSSPPKEIQPVLPPPSKPAQQIVPQP